MEFARLVIRTELGVPQIAVNVLFLRRHRELLGEQRFEQLLEEELGDEGRVKVRELLQQVSEN